MEIKEEEKVVAYVGIPKSLSGIRGFEKAVYYTKTSTENFFRLGGSQSSHVGMEEIKEMLADGSIERPNDPIVLGFMEDLWIDKNGSIYKGPFQNRTKDFIMKVHAKKE